MGCESAEFSVARDNNVRCRVCVGVSAAYWAPLMADDLCRRLADHAGGPSHRANAARWRSTGRIVLTAPSAAPAAESSRPLKRHCVGYLGARRLWTSLLESVRPHARPCLRTGDYIVNGDEGTKYSRKANFTCLLE